MSACDERKRYYLLHLPHHIQQFAVDHFDHLKTAKENVWDQTPNLVVTF